MHTTQNKQTSQFPVGILKNIGESAFPVPQNLVLSTTENDRSEVILDYGRAEGGIPFFETCHVERDGGPVSIEVTYSETSSGLMKEAGDGPFFLFSNAMDTYRVNTHTFQPSTSLKYVESPFAQKSQRYQKIAITTPNSSICFTSIGFRQLRKQLPVKSSFCCSNKTLEMIWNAGVRTVDMCTVEAGETMEAWEITENGTRVLGQHWAPCRQGTRWGDYHASFQVKIESGGASWGVHMVANGIIFCLDIQKKSLAAFEGLSDSGGVFPTISRGSWSIPPTIQLDAWLEVATVTRGSSMEVEINGCLIGALENLNVHPILGGSANNTGSIAFGGPAHYSSVYRSLIVRAPNGNILYENDMLLANKGQTMADFAVGSNELACTIDGAKRDRACFAGDLFVMGRSIYYSTGFTDAVLGSIKLLSSHQTADGYIGNLCPIQAPFHTGIEEPPTYAFYSLSYALALIVATKDYVLHTGDLSVVTNLQEPFQRLIAFTSSFQDERGLVVAPPPLSMDWLPMGGPIFGASGKINLAFYDALRAMSQLCRFIGVEDDSITKADALKENMRLEMWSKETQLLRMSDLIPGSGICQDIHAYGLTTGIIPANSEALSILKVPELGNFPLAFERIERWDATKVVSPYASGFATEALFSHDQGHAAVELIERVWGVMVDPRDPNYSGGLWEAMNQHGAPIADDTSLMHGWSTWPVFLLPQYLAGLQVLEPGWSRFRIRPVLAGIETVDVCLSTPAGEIRVSLCVNEQENTGTLDATIPIGTVAEIGAPKGWMLRYSIDTTTPLLASQITIDGKAEVIHIQMLKANQMDRWNDKGVFENRIKKVEDGETTPSSNESVVRPQHEKTSRGLLRRIAKIFCR